jgi:hypothetical protein
VGFSEWIFTILIIVSPLAVIVAMALLFNKQKQKRAEAENKAHHLSQWLAKKVRPRGKQAQQAQTNNVLAAEQRGGDNVITEASDAFRDPDSLGIGPVHEPAALQEVAALTEHERQDEEYLENAQHIHVDDMGQETRWEEGEAPVWQTIPSPPQTGFLPGQAHGVIPSFKVKPEPGTAEKLAARDQLEQELADLQTRIKRMKQLAAQLEDTVGPVDQYGRPDRIRAMIPDPQYAIKQSEPRQKLLDAENRQELARAFMLAEIFGPPKAKQSRNR